MSRQFEYYQERQPRPNDRYYQMLAQRQAVIDAWQQEEELKRNAEGFARQMEEQAEINRTYADFNTRQIHNPTVKH